MLILVLCQRCLDEWVRFQGYPPIGTIVLCGSYREVKNAKTSGALLQQAGVLSTSALYRHEASAAILR